MEIIISLVYGIIQALSEFLPISSSGHLALFPKVFSFKDPGVIYDFLLHVGTAVAMTVYFRNEIKNVLVQIYKRKFPEDPVLDSRYLFTSVITSIVLIFLLKGPALKIGRSPSLIGMNLIVFGVLLVLSEKLSKNNKSVGYKIAILVGLAQAIAVFPGVSRSGITITMGLFLGLSKVNAARFSFLMSIPIIYAGVLYKSPVLFAGEDLGFSLTSALIGTTASAIVGYFVIHWFLKFIQQISLMWFCLYRILIGVLVLTLL